MIAVIADDLTGAAEIAGLGWRYGLNSKIARRNQPPPGAELLVYDSDSRHCPADEAARRIESITRKLRKTSPVWVYKKVDSVLRGNVLAELEAMRCGLGLSRTLLVPANPSAGRVINDGRYFVDGVPLHCTDFANDPSHPRASDRVLELLGGSTGARFSSAKPRARVLAEGITVGDAVTLRDLDQWAKKVAPDTLATGGGEFFSALLALHGHSPQLSSTVRPEFKERVTLFVSGSLSETCLHFVAASRSRDWPVFEMPAELLARTHPNHHELLAKWSGQTSEALKRNRKVLMTIGRAEISSPGSGQRLESMLAEAACNVLKSVRVGEVCVEGGSTAAALLNALNWTALEVECEHARGVTAVHVIGVPKTSIVLKPGSYAWPRSVLG